VVVSFLLEVAIGC